MRSFFLLIAIFLCLNANGKAQGLDPALAISQYNYTSWDTDEGLPANGINSIAQANNGYLWLATFNGLVRFDGFDFEVFNQENINDLKISAFTGVYQDPIENIIWATTDGNGLIAFKDKNDIKIYTKDNGLPSNVTVSVLRDSKNRLWVGTTSGVSYLEEGKFKTLDNVGNIKNTMVNAIEEGLDGTIYFGTSKGLFAIDRSDSLISYSLNLSSLDINSLTFDNSGYLWIGTFNGINILDIKSNLLIKNKVTKALENILIYDVFVDNKQTIWIGSTKGLHRLSKNKLDLFIKDNKPQEITNILQDDEGNLWMSTYRSGFFKLTQGKILTTSMEEGLAANFVYGITETNDNKLFIATKKGLNIDIGGELSLLEVGGEPLSSTVRTVIESSDQKYHIGTVNGLYIVDPKGNYSFFNKDNGLNDNVIRDLWEDHDKNIWIGTSRGINILDSSGKISAITREDGLVNNFVISVFEDSSERVWVSTKNGFSVFENRQAKRIERKGEKLEGPVFTVTEDKEGTIWLGSSNGVMRYKDDTLKVISYKDGLPFNVVFQILADNKNKLWFTTNEGVFEIQKETINKLFDGEAMSDVEFRQYGKGDGMKSENCSAIARSIIRSNGEFVIPTFKGIATFHPDSLSPNTIAPTVYIESIKVDGEEAICQNDKYIIPASGKRVVINYTGLSFMAPEEIVFNYTLSGANEKFIDSGNERQASYMNLEPGNYKFKVLASNGDGIWNNVGQTIKLQKLPYFYQTIIFKILLVITLASLVFSYLYFRVRRIKKAKVELEKKVDEKTKELQRQNEEILTQNEEIFAQRESIRFQNSQLEKKNNELTALNEEKNHLIGVVAHDLKTPLNQIKGFLNIMKMEMGSRYEEGSIYIKMIEGTITRQNEMISKILDVNSIEAKKANFKFEKINIFKCVKATVETFYESARSKNINISFSESHSTYFINVDKGIYIQIIENLVSNSIKFSPPHSNITIKIEENEEGEVVFSVKDQGPGINNEDKKKIFGKYQKLSAKPTGGESSTGLGLSIVKMYVENMEGRVWFESEEGDGAVFFVAFKKD